MNDPWLPMIAALSGQRITPPSTWPARAVHRIDDQAAAVRSASRADRRWPNGGPTPLAKNFS